MPKASAWSRVMRAAGTSGILGGTAQTAQGSRRLRRLLLRLVASRAESGVRAFAPSRHLLLARHGSGLDLVQQQALGQGGGGIRRAQPRQGPAHRLGTRRPAVGERGTGKIEQLARPRLV